MTARARKAGDTAVRVGPAGATPALGTLETQVHEAMTCALALVTAPDSPNLLKLYRHRLDAIATRLPSLTRADVAADIGRFIAGSVTTGEHNLARCASRCAGRLAQRHRFPRQKETPT